MRWSRLLIPTVKETPQDAEVPSHQLMIRAGLMRKVASGTYTYLLTGWRVLLKVIRIVREEMNRSGAQEILMPSVHPRELWIRTGRDADYGQTLGRLATQAANLLMGKHKPTYSRHLDMGDYVVVVNAEKIRVTGNKRQDKKYYRHSGYMATYLADPFVQDKTADGEDVTVYGYEWLNPQPNQTIRRVRLRACGPSDATVLLFALTGLKTR